MSALVNTATGEISDPTLTPDEARSLTEAIVEATQALADDYSSIAVMYRRAYAGRAWEALGFGSWRDYCDNGVAAKIRFPREQRAMLVSSLREEGLSQQEIGAALGVDQKTVSRVIRQMPNEDAPGVRTNARGQQRPTSYERHAEPERPDAAGPHHGPSLPSAATMLGNAGPNTERAPQPPAADDSHDAETPSPAAGPQPYDTPLPLDDDVVDAEIVDDDEPPVARPSAEAYERHTEERDARVTREVFSKNLARSVWLLANYASVVGAAKTAVADFEDSQDIYPEPLSPARMRAAADYLHDVADEWEASR